MLTFWAQAAFWGSRPTFEAPDSSVPDVIAEALHVTVTGA
jgi:hypothetical protein